MDVVGLAVRQSAECDAVGRESVLSCLDFQQRCQHIPRPVSGIAVVEQESDPQFGSDSKLLLMRGTLLLV